MSARSLPIIDDHLHLDPCGKRSAAVKEFERAGGTHLILVHKPYQDATIKKSDDFGRAYDITIQLANEAREKTNVTIFIALAPHPSELTTLAKRMMLSDAVALMKQGIDAAGDYIQSGKAIALGEAGRPHYPVTKELWAASNELLRYEMETAKELDCAIVLHTESAGEETFNELATMADSVGLPRHRVVKHFSPPLVDTTKNHELFPSIVARESAIKKAIQQSNRFMMETDYIDEAERPEIVLPPSAVPTVTREFLSKGLFTENDAWHIHKHNPEKAYGISIDL